MTNEALRSHGSVLGLFAVSASVVMAWRLGGTIADSHYYHQVVLYIRGAIPQEALTAPFAYRLLAPAVAAVLPGDARWTFATLNWASVVLAATVIYLTHLRLGFPRRVAAVAGGLLIFSVPTFWYASYLTVDPLSVLLRSSLVYLVLGGAALTAPVVGLFAVTTREDNLVLLVALTIWTARQPRDDRAHQCPSPTAAWALASLLGACFLVSVRWHFDRIPTYFWRPTVAQTLANLTDTRGWLSIVGAAGVVVPLAIAGIRKHLREPGVRPELRLPLWLLAFAAAAPAYAYLCVRVEGRAVWSLYPFLIPFVMVAVTKASPGAGRATRP